MALRVVQYHTFPLHSPHAATLPVSLRWGFATVLPKKTAVGVLRQWYIPFCRLIGAPASLSMDSGSENLCLREMHTALRADCEALSLHAAKPPDLPVAARLTGSHGNVGVERSWTFLNVRIFTPLNNMIADLNRRYPSVTGYNGGDTVEAREALFSLAYVTWRVMEPTVPHFEHIRNVTVPDGQTRSPQEIHREDAGAWLPIDQLPLRLGLSEERAFQLYEEAAEQRQRTLARERGQQFRFRRPQLRRVPPELPEVGLDPLRDTPVDVLRLREMAWSDYVRSRGGPLNWGLAILNGVNVDGLMDGVSTFTQLSQALARDHWARLAQ